jgi:hypothetical protein
MCSDGDDAYMYGDDEDIDENEVCDKPISIAIM